MFQQNNAKRDLILEIWNGEMIEKFKESLQKRV